MYTKENAKLCTGTKTLHAWPMTKEQYCTYRGWDVPADENPEEAGYLIEYSDGGKKNHPNHDGYVSWSPADVFEKTYRETPDDWAGRIRAELHDLNAKREKLTEFLRSDRSRDLTPHARTLLTIQSDTMAMYAYTLAARLPESE
jgi:hypothetical protein